MIHPAQDKSPREIELKFAVPANSLEAVAHFIAQKTPVDGQVPVQHQVTTYFDTQDHTLSRVGISLRVRSTNGQRIQTLKADRKIGVAADRAEWEWPVDCDEPNLALLAETPLAGNLPREAVLEPIFATDIDRTIRTLALDGGTIVEVAVDQGSIIAGKVHQPVRELELELQVGEVAALLRLASELHATAALTIESESKAARGYRLRTGALPVAYKAENLSLKHDISGTQAFRQIVSAELGHLVANQPAALAGDAEGVHQMRVAIRRLRAALTLFRRHLEPEKASLFQAELQRVGRILGEVRDWDVFCQQILPNQAENASRWSTLLRQPAMARRAHAYQRFARELTDPLFTTLVLGLSAWIEQDNLFGRSSLGEPIKMLAPSLLDSMAKKVERRGRRIGDQSDTERHALRKSLKKLRYSTEFMHSLLPHRSAKIYLAKCKNLQKSLGDMNDVVTATVLGTDLANAENSELRPAVTTMTKQLEQRQGDALDELTREWEEFKKTPRFWA